MLLRLFQISRRFNIEIQPQLVLLQKTLLNIEGLGRQLDPDLDLWQTAKPFLERWMNEQVGWRGLLRSAAARGALLGGDAAAAAAPAAPAARARTGRRALQRAARAAARGRTRAATTCSARSSPAGAIAALLAVSLL